MTPLAHFELVWERCNHLSVLHSYMAPKTSKAFNLDELLRSEWVARVSALDLYIHEIVSQQMLEIFQGQRNKTPAYLKFQISNETMERIHTSVDSAKDAAFALEVRNQLSHNTFQDPDKIAEGIRLCSHIELWNEIATKLGATNSTRIEKAKFLKKELSLIVQRRNKIAHEGDLQPAPPRDVWTISRKDLLFVKEKIETLVRTIDVLLNPPIS